MAQAIIDKIEFNQAKGRFTGAFLYATTDKGQKKKEFVFDNSPVHRKLQTLKAGDSVNLKYVQKGEFWNLADIEPLGAGSGNVTAPRSAPISGGTQSVIPSKSGYQPRYMDSEEYVKHRDLMIIRQSTTKVAGDIVAAMLAKDMFKKTATPDFIVEEVGRLAAKLEGQITGSTAKATLAASVSTLETNEPVYDEDCPFPE